MPETLEPEKIYDPSTDGVPTTVRFQSVLYYMDREPAIKERLSNAVIKVKKRDGTVMEYPKEVFDVTCILHKQGKDAISAGKSEILNAARSYFGMSSAPSSKQVSEAGSDTVSQTIYGMISLAADIVERYPNSRGRHSAAELKSELNSLAKRMGFSGEVRMTPVIPFALVQSAAQLAEISPELKKHRAEMDLVVRKFQRITAEG